MPIELECGCGRSLRVKDSLANRKIRCPDCDASLLVPNLENEGDAPPPVNKPRIARVSEDQRDPPRRAAKTQVIDEDDEEDRPRKKRRRDDDDDDEDYKPRPKKRKKNIPAADTSFSSRAPILAGCLMMLGAVVWFVLGLMADRIFIYPPILFVLGILSIGRGLMPK